MRPNTKRVRLPVPVSIFGYDFCGEPFNEVTETLEIGADGGLIELGAPIAREHPFLLINMATGRAAGCRVSSLQIASNGKAHVGVRFALPSPQFWGRDFSPEEEVHHATQERLVPALA
jgi:hypothetical protein